MDEKPHQWFGIRDLLWLAVLGIVLAAWGWDRGRLARRIDSMPIQVPALGLPLPQVISVDFAYPIGQER